MIGDYAGLTSLLLGWCVAMHFSQHIMWECVQDLDDPHSEGVCAHCKAERLSMSHRLLQVWMHRVVFDK